MMYSTSMFIFRRDLRLADNTALLAALAKSKTVIACFIFTPQQIGPKNPYKSDNAIQFMLESLEDLSTQLAQSNGRLYFFHGEPSAVLETVAKEIMIEAVFVNKDYTPFSIERDKALANTCKKLGLDFHSYHDALLHSPEAAVKKDGKPYTIFTPYFNNAKNLPIVNPVKNSHTNYYTKPLANMHEKIIGQKPNDHIFVHGGRDQALAILADIKNYRDYENIRNTPSIAGTTGLAAHLKFGTCSVREAYQAIAKTLGAGHPLIRQLFWRDFFTHIASHVPSVFGHAFNPKYQHIAWENDTKKFQAWCEGKTGFPIVDAGMRQLNTTGWMHNRVRMIVASFLVKDLHIDWRMGEQYFATKLVDYDPAVNNGNWQWAASTGCDAQPYFRIFNPWLQGQTHDPDCLYIKKWVPEIKNLTPKEIHSWESCTTKTALPYPKPIVQHAIVSKIAISLFKY